MTLTLPHRFRGPALSGNGGYTAGLVAERLLGSRPDGPHAAAQPVRVRLHTPPPLDTDLSIDLDPADGTATLRHGSIVVATAAWSQLERDVVPPVDLDEAMAAVSAYAGATDHPFPGCFACGTDRAAGDGLRLFPGLVGPGRTACPWQPDPSVADPAGAVPSQVVWAALDCPGGWTSDLTGRPMVLGTMTATVVRAPAVGEQCVVVGRLDATDDRRSFTATTLYGAPGDVLARAEAVWIRVDPTLFERLEGAAS